MCLQLFTLLRRLLKSPTVFSRQTLAGRQLPVGLPTAFEGNIRLVEPDTYGFFYCNITSPASLKHPILHRKIKGRGTVAGLGSWTGWITRRLGYKSDPQKHYHIIDSTPCNPLRLRAKCSPMSHSG